MSALDDLLGLLRCPHCGASLARAGAEVRCAGGHSFDVARQGYLSLLAGDSAHSGDSADMVAARERFLSAGHFDPLSAQLGAGLGDPARVVDLGAGTGRHLARALDDLPSARGLALDVSKPALRRAARAHARAAAVACDVWGPLPLRDGAADAALTLFAPRNPPELARVLRRGGRALIVTAAPGHLAELAEPLGLLAVGEGKRERLDEQLAPELELVERRELEWTLALDRAGARDLAAMGPSAFHVDRVELGERVAALPDSVTVTAAVTLTLAGRP
jgi:23S rRNA (guanine745-N1)-methyltransferase